MHHVQWNSASGGVDSIDGRENFVDWKGHWAELKRVWRHYEHHLSHYLESLVLMEMFQADWNEHQSSNGTQEYVEQRVVFVLVMEEE